MRKNPRAAQHAPVTSPVTRSGAIAPTLGSEHEEQVALFQWAATMEGRLPALMMLFAVPNGGHRHKAVARRMRAEGQKAGVLDVWLPIPRKEYHALIIEMKVGRNRLSPEQRWWADRLTEHGYCVAVCYGWLQAARGIVRYLGERPEEYGL